MELDADEVVSYIILSGIGDNYKEFDELLTIELVFNIVEKGLYTKLEGNIIQYIYGLMSGVIGSYMIREELKREEELLKDGELNIVIGIDVTYDKTGNQGYRTKPYETIIQEVRTEYTGEYTVTSKDIRNFKEFIKWYYRYNFGRYFEGVRLGDRYIEHYHGGRIRDFIKGLAYYYNNNLDKEDEYLGIKLKYGDIGIHKSVMTEEERIELLKDISKGVRLMCKKDEFGKGTHELFITHLVEQDIVRALRELKYK